jgi:hypothetical protein
MMVDTPPDPPDMVDTPPDNPPDMVDTPPDNPPDMVDTPPDNPPDNPANAVSAADRARAEGLLSRASSAVDGNDLEGAIGSLRGAQGILGRSDPRVRNVRSALARRASNKIGILLQQGNCPEAQRVFRSLRSVGADGPSRAHFGDWCRP